MRENKLSTHIVGFRLHLERLGYSKSSTHMLPNCVRAFLEHQPHNQLENITSADIVCFKEYLQERPHQRRAGGLSERYIHHHMYGLKLFFRWQQEKGSLQQNPISPLEFTTPRSTPRTILTQDEIKSNNYTKPQKRIENEQYYPFFMAVDSAEPKAKN